MGKSKGQLVQQMLMVKLNISYDTGYRSSDEMREIIHDNNATSKNRMRAGVRMFNKEEIRSFTEKISQARSYYLHSTLPWDKKNWRVIPVSKWQEFKNVLDQYVVEIKDEFDKIFMDNYDDLKASFQKDCNLDDVEFPEKGDIASKFNVHYDIGQIASCDDIRIQGIDHMEREKIRTDMRNQYDKKIGSGLNELAERLVKATEDVAVRAKDEDQKGKKYTKSLSNLSELADTVESLNITGNEAIIEACKIIRNDISTYSAEAIKTTESVRETVVDATSSIKDKLSGIKI